jgi:hypothetical protein
VALFGRTKFGRNKFGRTKPRPGTTRGASPHDLRHLEEFVATRSGVEGYLEPRTTVTETTLVLVADDGEWTRRRVESPRAAADFARRRTMPLYDAAKVGYPKRMREWTARRKAEGSGGRTDRRTDGRGPSS